TEHRAALHYLLRWPDGRTRDAPQKYTQEMRAQVAQPDLALKGSSNLQATLQDVLCTRKAMLAFAEAVRQDEQMTDVVNIGIGGSDLGPQLAIQALDDFKQGAESAGLKIQPKRFHFVSSLDPQELMSVLRQVRPQSTLFLVASKSFTTLETMTNARAARAWFLAEGGTDVARHFVALSANTQAAAGFGISTCFGFWDWVGGRYSLWSSIGLSVAIAIGAQHFQDMLAGAHAMDQHFATTPLERNLPVQLALLDVWYRNFHGMGSRCVAPYAYGLRRLPAYLQQLEMESNGKRVDQQGQTLPYSTAPVVWGEPASNGQHAFFQMLHQGTDVVPVEFVVVKQAPPNLPSYMSQHQPELLANALAQAQALTQGVLPSLDGQNVPAYREMPGNRPSTTLLLEALTPRSLGALIALYEHRVLVQAALWGINPFDQYGVELGKTLAQDLRPRLNSGDSSGLDPSTAAMLARLSQTKTLSESEAG
ncbi:MAG: glucose-6-phosphate isomerase, partial [Betaproteobacteria bacterium]|nr:glucose-6-phosphate isomerase [Betaproteobacteria bacterium]